MKIFKKDLLRSANKYAALRVTRDPLFNFLWYSINCDMEQHVIDILSGNNTFVWKHHCWSTTSAIIAALTADYRISVNWHGHMVEVDELASFTTLKSHPLAHIGHKSIEPVDITIEFKPAPTGLSGVFIVFNKKVTS